MCWLYNGKLCARVCIYFMMISQFSKPNNVFHTKSLFDGEMLDSLESVALHYRKKWTATLHAYAYYYICVEQVFVFAVEKSTASFPCINYRVSKIANNYINHLFLQRSMETFTWCIFDRNFLLISSEREAKRFWVNGLSGAHINIVNPILSNGFLPRTFLKWRTIQHS